MTEYASLKQEWETSKLIMFYNYHKRHRRSEKCKNNKPKMSIPTYKKQGIYAMKLCILANKGFFSLPKTGYEQRLTSPHLCYWTDHKQHWVHVGIHRKKVFNPHNENRRILLNPFKD